MTLAPSSLARIGPVSESSFSPTLGSMTPTPAQSLHLAGDREPENRNSGTKGSRGKDRKSSCMQEGTSEVGLQRPRRALRAQGGSWQRGGEAVDSVTGEWWAQPGHGKWAEDMTAEVGDKGQVRKCLKSTRKLHSAFCTVSNGQPSGAK